MNSYCEKYLGKELSELEWYDISNFFAVQKEESDNIEFKSFHKSDGKSSKKIEGVIRGLCAFLNSNGGILIWGAPEEKKENGKSIFSGALSPVSEFFEKDTLISKISDSITPMPIDIAVERLESAGKYLYIFQVQKSNYSPHQFKNTYYARLDGQTKPAPHYLIDALFKKVSYPNIQGFLNFEKITQDSEKSTLFVSIILMNFSELINEHDIVASLFCPQAKFLGHDQHYHGKNKKYGMHGHEYINSGKIPILHNGAPYYETHRLIFSFEELSDKHNSELDFLLTFGGKKSPLKVSKYKLKFEGSFASDNLFKNVVSHSENNLFVDMEEGITKEETLHKILKR